MAGRLDRPRTSNLNGSSATAASNTAVVASARLVTRTSDRTIDRTKGGIKWEVKEDNWQREAWAYIDSIGELGYLVDQVARTTSRSRLVAAKISKTPGAEPEIIDIGKASINDQMAVDLVRRFAGGPAGQTLLIDRMAAQLQVAGDSYLTGLDDDSLPGGVLWQVYSPGEIKSRGQKWQIDDGHGKREYDDTEILVVRIWRAHRRHSGRSTSPVLRNLPVLRELEGLTKDVSARIDSRLAGAGILALPQEMSFPVNPEDPERAGVDNFIEELTEAMMTAIENRDSAEALVPIIMTAPGEVLKNIQHITFSQELAEVNKVLRDEAIRRIALGMDAPPEVLMGSGDSSHWNAWSVTEDFLKTHIEPLLTLMVDGLTVGYLQPALRSLGISDVDAEEYIVWYDTTDLALRPDRSSEAERAFDRHAIDSTAYRRELGFDETDAPTKEELIVQMLLQVGRNPQGAVQIAGILLAFLGEEDLAMALEEVAGALGAINQENPDRRGEQDDGARESGTSSKSDPGDDPRPNE